MSTSPKNLQKQVMLLLLFAIPVWAQPINCDKGICRIKIPDILRLLTTLQLPSWTPRNIHGGLEQRLCSIAIQKALEDINEFPGLLEGYVLTNYYVDIPSCKETDLKGLEDAQRKYKFPYVLIGGQCSITTEYILKYLRPDRSPIQISAYPATPSDWEDRTSTDYRLYRLTASERLGLALVQLLATYNWSRVAIICQEGEREQYSKTIRDILKKPKVTKVDVIATTLISDGFNSDAVSPVLQALKVLKHLDARIIVASADEYRCMEIMCNAYKLDIYGKHFVWIFTKPIEPISMFYDHIDCTFEEMQNALEGVFYMMPRYLFPFEEMSIANITYSDLIADIFYRLNVSIPNGYGYENIGKCYDHVWVAALALNCSVYSPDAMIVRMHEDDRKKRNSAHLRYGNDPNSRYEWLNGGPIWKNFRHYMNIMVPCIDMLDFVGTTGRIRFDEGAVNPNIVIFRIQDKKGTDVAYFRQGNDPNSRYEWLNGGPIWKDDYIPVDSTRTMQTAKSIPMALYLTMCVLFGVGIIVTIACFVFNVIWRKHRIVKMSSPNINSIILAGCLLLYVTVIIQTTAPTAKAMCAVRLFCFSIGFATAFGSMLSKTWRVHKIFNNKKMIRKMSIRDKDLLVIIGIVVTMETALLIIWESFSPHRVIEQQLKTENVTTESGDKAVMVSFYRVCFSDHSSYFIWTLRIMNGALIVVGVILAWETRQVHIDALNDSKTIGICLYNVLILSAVDMCLSLMIGDKPVELIGINCVCIFVGTLASEMLIFLPKMLAVYRYPIATPPTAVNTGECLTTSRIATQPIEELAINSPAMEQPISTPTPALNNLESLTPSSIITQHIEVFAIHTPEQDSTN